MIRRSIAVVLVMIFALGASVKAESQSAADMSLSEYFIGVYYSSRGDCGQAIPHFIKAKDLFKNADIYLELSDCYSYQGTMEKAMATLDEGIRFFQEDGRLYAAKGELYYSLYQAGMPSEDIVRQAYDNLLKGWELASDVEAGSKSVEMAAALKKTDQAMKLYESFPLEMRKQPPLLVVMLNVYQAAGLKNRLRKTIKMISNIQLKDKPDLLNHVVNLSITNGFYKEALKLMQQQIQGNPGSFSDWDKYMFVALAASDCKTVYNVFQERYRKNPTALSLYSMASCLGRQHRYREATAYFKRALSIGDSGWGDSVHLEVMRDYLKVLVASGNYKKALTVAAEGLRLFPDSPALKTDLVYIDVLNRRIRQAIQTAASLAKDGESPLLNYLKKNPSFLKYYFRGMVFYALEDYDNAFVQLKKAHRMEPANRDIAVPLAMIYDRRGKQGKVISLYRGLLKVYPNDALLLNNFSYSLLTYNRQLKEALEMAKEAVKLTPENPTYRDTLGYAYLLLGNLDEAEENLKFAYQKSPQSGEICQHLGEVYFRKGEFRKARELWLEAIENGGVDEASLKKKISFLGR